MKQRLVGLLVVLALLAIFMPMISYKMEPKRPTHLSTNIPNPPDLPKIQLANNSSPTQVSSSSSSATDWSRSAENVLSPGVQNTIWAVGSGRVLIGTQPTASLAQNELSTTPKMEVPTEVKQKPEKMAAAATTEAKQQPTNMATSPKHQSTTLAEGSWIIQLGIFSNSKNIQVLMGKLSNKGIPAFKQNAFSHNGQKMVRIFVGPLLTENQAAQMKKQLQEQIHISGIIKRKTA